MSTLYLYPFRAEEVVSQWHKVTCPAYKGKKWKNYNLKLSLWLNNNCKSKHMLFFLKNLHFFPILNKFHKAYDHIIIIIVVHCFFLKFIPTLRSLQLSRPLYQTPTCSLLTSPYYSPLQHLLLSCRLLISLYLAHLTKKPHRFFTS